MSTLEVFHNHPAKNRALLSTIGCVDPSYSNLVAFSHEKYYTPWLPTQLAFIIEVVIHGKNIHHSIVDEGYLTCIMSMSCWKAIGSPQLIQ